METMNDAPAPASAQQLVLQHADILRRAASLPVDDAEQLLDTRIKAAKEHMEPSKRKLADNQGIEWLLSWLILPPASFL